MHDLSHIHKIMDFTKNYQLNYIDEQTLVIEPILSHNKTDKTVNFSDTIHP